MDGVSFEDFDDDSVMFIKWEWIGQKLKGYILVYYEGPAEKLILYGYSFDGVLNGGNISLTLNDSREVRGFKVRLGPDKTITGTLRGETLASPPVNGTEPVVFRHAQGCVRRPRSIQD